MRNKTSTRLHSYKNCRSNFRIYISYTTKDAQSLFLHGVFSECSHDLFLFAVICRFSAEDNKSLYHVSHIRSEIL